MIVTARSSVVALCALICLPSFGSPAGTGGKGPGEGRYVVDGVAAFVGGAPVTVGDVLRMLEPLRREMQGKSGGSESAELVRKGYAEALGRSVEKRLILESAGQQGLKIPGWAVEQRVEEIVHEMFRDDRGALLKALDRERLLFDEWQADIRDQLVVASLRGMKTDRSMIVAPGRVREAYESNPGKYGRPERIKLRMIELYGGSASANAESSGKRAEEVMKSLRNGEDFAEVARKHSDGTRTEEGGDWGWIDPRKLRPELAEAAMKLGEGRISQPLEIENQVYILKVEGREGTEAVRLTDALAAIERELRGKAIESQYRAWIGRLRDRTYVKILDVEVQP